VALHRFDFTATIFRGVADGRGSSAPMPRRWCLQIEISASAIRRGRRKRRETNERVWLKQNVFYELRQMLRLLAMLPHHHNQISIEAVR
jgi:hypothetical protein